MQNMAMSNLYSKISQKPVKRLQDINVLQTNQWANGEYSPNLVSTKIIFNDMKNHSRTVMHIF